MQNMKDAYQHAQEAPTRYVGRLPIQATWHPATRNRHRRGVI